MYILVSYSTPISLCSISMHMCKKLTKKKVALSVRTSLFGKWIYLHIYTFERLQIRI